MSYSVRYLGRGFDSMSMLLFSSFVIFGWRVKFFPRWPSWSPCLRVGMTLDIHTNIVLCFGNTPITHPLLRPSSAAENCDVTRWLRMFISLVWKYTYFMLMCTVPNLDHLDSIPRIKVTCVKYHVRSSILSAWDSRRLASGWWTVSGSYIFADGKYLLFNIQVIDAWASSHIWLIHEICVAGRFFI